MAGVIYKITNPSGRSYIGKSINWKKRYNKYKNLMCKLQPILYNSFIKYGFENHTFEILMQNIPEEQLSAWEQIWIWAEGAFEEGLNCTEGGDGAGKMSAKTKKKISESCLGRKHSPETKQKMSKSHSGINNINFGKTKEKNHLFGKPRSDKTKKKISDSNKGKVITEEVRKKISNSLLGRFSGEKNPNYGKKMSPEMKQILAESRKGKPRKKQSLETVQKRIKTRAYNKSLKLSNQCKLLENK